jgi:hypothetical protein
MTASSIELEQISRSQTRQQILLIILCILVAASTVATWRSASALREANKLQKEFSAQSAEGSRKAPQARRANARAATKASAESHRPTNPRAQGSTGDKRGTAESAPHGDPTGTRVALVHQGRQ